MSGVLLNLIKQVVLAQKQENCRACFPLSICKHYDLR